MRSHDWLCRCEEVTAEEIRRAIDAGARTVNDVKRQTRAGMGLCQGAYCLCEIARLLSEVSGTPLAAIAPMTARPPVRLVSIGVLIDAAE
jgi:NAD(P)H-nitrite reductase large subunit